MLRVVNNLFKETKNEIKNLNKEYEQLSQHNKQKASDIKDSINRKSNLFEKRKKERSSHFDFIRNK